MKIIKNLWFILIFFVAIIFISCDISKAAGTEIPSSTKEMSDWIKSGDEKYFTMDALKLVKRSIALSEYNNGTWICYNQNDNTSNQSTTVRIKNVIDITADSVTIYYQDASTKKASSQEAGKYAREALQQAGYWLINANSALEREIRTVNILWKNKAVLQKNNVHVPNISSNANYPKGKFPSGRKLRMVIGSIASGQDRIWYGYKKGEEGTIKVRKRDDNTNSCLSGAVFEVRSKDGTIVRTAKTNYKGWAPFKGLPLKTYEIREIKAPNGYEPNDEVKTVKLTKDGQTELFTYRNKEKEGKVNIYKYISETTKQPIEGVKFMAVAVEPERPGAEPTKPTPPSRPVKGENQSDEDYQKELEAYNKKYDNYLSRLNAYNMAYKEWFTKKQVYDIYLTHQDPVYATTNAAGRATFDGLVEVLQYQIKEAPAEEQSEEIRKYFELSTKVETIDIKGDKTIKLYFYNPRIAVDIKGFVWEDKNQNKGAEQIQYNSIYDQNADPMEDLVQHIKVRLLDKNGNPIKCESNVNPQKGSATQDFSGIAESWTDVGGEYFFKCVKIADLEGAYVEFEYNGMKYKSVIPRNTYTSNEIENGINLITSQAQDLKIDRDRLTQTYKTISNTVPPIEYDRGEAYTSRVIYTDFNRGNEAYKTEQYGKDEYHVKATTLEAGLDMMDYYNISEAEASGVIDINFGIVLREQPDLALKKDIDKVKVSVKNPQYTQVYGYGNRFKNEQEEKVQSGVIEEGQNLNSYYNTSTKFDGLYGQTSYSRHLYEADIMYEGENQLDVKVIYRIGLKNKASSLISTVDQITDYFSPQFSSDRKDIKIGQIDTNTGNFTEIYDNFTIETSDVNGYNKMTINKAFEIKKETTTQFYVELTVKRDTLVEMAKGNGGGKSLQIEVENFMEIEKYSTKDSEGNDYAGIDENSQPGNMIPNQKETYEDDMDRAPGLTIGLKEEREIQGNIFLDSTNPEKQQGEERNGNGEFDKGESLVKVQKVELIDIETNEIANIYDKNEKIFKKAEYTNVDTLNISGLIPGKYVLRYTWGDGKTTTYEVNGETHYISAQKYKGTIYKDESRAQNELWYKESGIRYSDAIDNYEKRKEIDSKFKTFKNDVAKNGDYSSMTMDSNTPIMNMYLENCITGVTIEYENEKQEYILDDRGNFIYNEDGSAQMKDGTKYVAGNVDFGIAERARQELKLDKDIKRMSLIGTDGILLIDVQFNDEGKPILGEYTQYVTYVGPSPTEPKGILKSEIDNELIQSANLIVQYQYKVVNTSEVDYSNETYYKYGTGQNANDLVHLNPSKIIDYIDNTMQKYTDESNERYGDNAKWTILESEEDKRKLLTEGYIGTELEEQLINKVDKVAIIDNFVEGNGLIPIVGKNTQLQKGINFDTVTFTTSRLLANKQDEINIFNYAEIVTTDRNSTDSTGAKIDKSIPGNYNIYEELYKAVEPDSSYADEVTIIPPTGENRGIAVYVVIGVISLAIIATGVIVIKKFIIK